MDKIKAGEWVRNIDGKFGIFDRYSSRKSSSFYKSPFDCFVKMQKRKTSLQCHREYIKNHSKNKIELLEDGDFVELEYKSPKYRKRITRVFEVSKLDEYILFENYHCNFFCKKGDKKITDKTCKNIKIKSIVTHEQFESMKYNFEEE